MNDKNDDDLIISDEKTLEIRKKLWDALDNYQKTMSYMVADAPIGVLCLPKK